MGRWWRNPWKPNWPKVLDEKIDDPCFRGRYVDLYMNGRVRAINDIYQEPGLTDCHIRTLEQYDVKANLVAPIRKDNQLFALLIAHQCSAPRAWQKSEIDFFSELATQAEYALDHISFIEKLEQARQTAEISLPRTAPAKRGDSESTGRIAQRYPRGCQRRPYRSLSRSKRVKWVLLLTS